MFQSEHVKIASFFGKKIRVHTENRCHLTGLKLIYMAVTTTVHMIFAVKAKKNICVCFRFQL